MWICPSPNGHIQATGLDARGRKRYRYHPKWRELRDQDKYEHIIQFAAAVPGLRKRVAADMKRDGLPHEKVLATIVSLLEKTLIRVGNAEYAEKKQILRAHHHACTPQMAGAVLGRNRSFVQIPDDLTWCRPAARSRLATARFGCRPRRYRPFPRSRRRRHLLRSPLPAPQGNQLFPGTVRAGHSVLLVAGEGLEPPTPGL